MNTSQAIRASLIGNSLITDRLGKWRNNPSLFTRRPAPVDAEFPIGIISKPTGQFHQDGLTSIIGTEIRQVAFYAQNPATEREDEELAEIAKYHFHQQKGSLLISGFHVIQVTARGPLDAPTSDETLTGSVILLQIRTEKL